MRIRSLLDKYFQSGMVAVLLLFGLVGCETIGYYRQAIGGQLAVTFARQPLDRVVADPATSPALRQRLQATTQMLSYIERELGIVPGRRYRSYVQLDRDAVVYNLVATPQFSVEPRSWCYPIAGCAPYRGYFDRAKADAAALRLAQQGYVTAVGRVPAYSTLGWFADPLLSTFVFWNDAQLMALLAHELSHSRVWVDSDVAFNEAFATFVGEQTARNWLQQDQPELLAQYTTAQRQWQALVALLLELKATLAAGYGLAATDAQKQALTERAYRAFRSCYAAQREQLGGVRFDEYVAALNNATLAALATYRDNVPAFAVLYARSNGDWPVFFQAVDVLAALPPARRAEQLQALVQSLSGQQQITQRCDDCGPDQVQCQALANHGVDGYLP